MVSKRDLLRKVANIKDKNNDAAVYVGCSVMCTILYFVFTNRDLIN